MRLGLSLSRSGIILYQNYDEFYQCLAYDGCGYWRDGFKSPDRYISIQLNGLGRGKGYIYLEYEAQPEWDQAFDQNKADKKAVTKKGL